MTMEIHIIGHQDFKVTPALENHVIAQLKKLEKHLPNITKIEVTLRVEKTQHMAEARAFAGGKGPDIFAHASETKDMYMAIDALGKKLLVQVDKRKGKQHGHRG